MSLSIAAMGLATSFWQMLVLAVLSGVGNSVDPSGGLRDPVGSVDKDRMGRSFALHTFSGNLGFSAGAPVTAFLMAAVGWRGTLADRRPSGRAGGAVHPAAEPHPEGSGPRPCRKPAGPSLSGRDLLTSRTMMLFFLFFMFGAMAGGGVQAWLVTVLHTVKGIDLPVAATALTAYMVGSTLGVLFGGWFADTVQARTSCRS